jgi:amidohydrolase
VKAEEREYLIAFRRELHAYPELGRQEHRTSARLAEELESLGLEVHRAVGGTGVVGILSGVQPGRSWAYRADMDALPVCEPEGLAFRSQNPGVMHACGHDVHCTIALGIARQAALHRKNLRGRLLFVFQPNEEGAPGGGTGGAQAMVDDGLLERFGIEAIFAMHCKPDLEVGEIGFTRGGAWASCDHFYIDVVGQQTHGAYPHLGKDPIVAAAQLIDALAQIPSRRVDARKPALISTCMVHGGEAFNILPEVVKLEGIVRALDRDVRNRLNAAIEATVKGIATAHELQASVEIHPGADVTVNDDALMDAALAHLRGSVKLIETPPQMGAEDFSVFAALIPGLYLQLGVRDRSRPYAPLHSPKLSIDEDCIPIAVDAMAPFLMDLELSTESTEG